MAWINGVEVPDDQLPSWAAGASSFERYREQLPVVKARHWDAVEARVLESTYERPAVQVDEWGVITIPEPGLCPGVTQKYSTLPPVHCARPAGAGTVHEGIGLCSTHRGAQGAGQVQGAVEMALLFADEMQVTPWEALLSQVRLLAQQVRWLQIRVQNAELEFGVDAIKPGGPAWEWVALLEARGDRLAKVSKMALDAGVAERLVYQVNVETEAMVDAANSLMDQLGLTGEAREKALEHMGMRLLELESKANTKDMLK